MKRTIVVSLIVLLSLTSFFEALPLTSFVAASPAWSNGAPLITSAGINQEPAVLQATDGTVWISWSQHSKTVGTDRVFYRTMIRNGGVWTNSSTLQLGTSFKAITPALGQVDQNTILQVRAENQSRYYSLVGQEYFLGNQTWNAPFNITSASASDTFPSIAAARNGTSWLFWNRQVGNDTQIYYKTLTNGAWSSAETKLTSGPNVNLYPVATVGSDGRIMLAYASGSGGTYQIMYNTFTTGWVGSAPVTPLSTSGNSDKRPAIVQDRNGTSWIFWERVIQITTTLFTFKIFGKSDMNYGGSVGQNWLSDPETQLTNDAQQVTDQHPAAVQSVRDKSLWVVFSTNIANAGEFDLYVMKAIVAPVHDLLVLGFNISPSNCLNGITYVCFNTNPLEIFSIAGNDINNYAVCAGPPIFNCPINQSTNVTVTVALWNRGDYPENVTLNINATSSLPSIHVTTQTVLNLLAGNQTTVNVNWNTVGVHPGHWGLSIGATIPVEPALDKPDGLLAMKNQVWLLPPGDVDLDGSVTITDISNVFLNYGHSCKTVVSCDPRYIAAQYADFHNQGIIDIVDVGIVLADFGILT